MGFYSAFKGLIIIILVRMLRLGWLSRYSDSLRAARSGDRIPAGGEVFITRPNRHCDLFSLQYNCYGGFPGVKRPGRGVDNPPGFEIKGRVEL